MVTMPSPRSKVASSTVPATCRVLVIGLGSIGQRHAGLLAERPDVELVVCDGAAARLEETRQRLGDARVQLFDSVETAISQSPEVVFVCTPDASHVTLAMHALRAGADLFVEKPIAHSVAAAIELVDAARRKGRFLQVGYMLRYDPGLQYIHHAVASGELGSVTGGRAMIGTYLTLVNAKNPYREREPFVLPYDYTHEFDFIRWIFGEPVDVLARAATVGTLPKRPVPNVLQSILTMPSGALVQVHMDYVQFPQRRMLEVFGDRGTISYDFMTGELRHYRFGAEHVWETLSLGPIMDRVNDLYRAQTQDLFHRRRSGERPLVDGMDALATLKLADRAVASARHAVVGRGPGSNDQP